MSQQSSHRLDERTAELIVRLTAAGAELLRAEDAYHLALLTHHQESDEVTNAAQERAHVRATYRHLLLATTEAFASVTH